MYLYQKECDESCGQVPLTFPIVFDADRSLGKLWSPPKIPTVFLVERDGFTSTAADATLPRCPRSTP